MKSERQGVLFTVSSPPGTEEVIWGVEIYSFKWGGKENLSDRNLKVNECRPSEASVEFFFSVDSLKLQGTNTKHFKMLMNLMNIYSQSLNTAKASARLPNGLLRRLTGL